METKQQAAAPPPRNIYEAAERGLLGWIVKAVERSVEYNINQRDKLQRSALHWAAESGQVAVVEALLDYGCDRSATECCGRTAFHLAVRGLHVDVMAALLEGMTQSEVEYAVNNTDNHGITPAYLALQKGAEGRPCFNFLMTHGARYNSSSFLKREQEHSLVDVPLSISSSSSSSVGPSSVASGSKPLSVSSISSSSTGGPWGLSLKPGSVGF